MYFIEKEGKYFNYIKGSTTLDSNNRFDTDNFQVQGIGIAQSVSGDTDQTLFTLNIENT